MSLPSIFSVANLTRVALTIELSTQESAKTRPQKAFAPTHVACIQLAPSNSRAE